MTSAVENTAWFDDQTRCVNLARHYALSLDLNSALGKNHPIESAGDGHVIALNLALDSGRLAENQTVLGEDVSLYLAVYTEGPS